MNVQTFFTTLWQDYLAIAPQASAIRQLFLQTDAEVINDHVAFRTFAECPLDLAALQPVVLGMGYKVQDDYQFNEKKVCARSYIHPDPKVPKIFLSELERHKLSSTAQAILARYCAQIEVAQLTPAIFWSGRHWDMPSLQDYQALLAESEYAAWLVTIGLRVNHFTVSINHLTSSQDIHALLQRVEDAGFTINSSGGRVKGSPECLLEQGSTMAERMEVTFAGGEKHSVPTCFYEFAKRYPDASGELYQGFVSANADKIFESTAAM